jgi:hypothetical protein
MDFERCPTTRKFKDSLHECEFCVSLTICFRMFRKYRWPRQSYIFNPATAPNLPQDISSAVWLKRTNVRAVLENKLPMEFADSELRAVLLHFRVLR